MSRHRKLKDRSHSQTSEAIVGNEAIQKMLSPDWILDCVMYDRKQHSLVVSPLHCMEHNVTGIDIAQDRFYTRNILHFRVDYDIRKVKRHNKELSPHE